MANPFVKVYGSILDSSIWLEDDKTRIVWFTMLAMAGEDGVVRASVGGLAHRARVDRDAVVEALEKFRNPDPDSKSPEYDGRRIQDVSDGFLVLNHQRYRDLRTKTQVQTAARVKRHRDKRYRNDVTQSNAGATPETPEADREAEIRTHSVRTLSPASPASTASRQRKPLQQDLLSSKLDVEAVFERWKTVHAHPEAKLTEKRAKAIKARLKDSTVDEINLAIDGCKTSAFHQGENESGKVYDDIALICRDREHVEQFMREARPGGSKPEPDSPEAIEAEKEQWRREAEERAAQRERERAEALAMPYADELPK